MREKFKLRKNKVVLVSVAIASMYITMQGQAEASENVAEDSQSTSIQKVEKEQAESKNQLMNETRTNVVVQHTKAMGRKKTDAK
ncbi:hypothetical protein KDL01_42520, partial [Actinospica durhamensis]|nr:hypothetical protein [Actinospica durhamensis]